MSFLYHKNTKRVMQWIWGIFAIIIILSMVLAYSGGLSGLFASSNVPSNTPNPVSSNDNSNDNQSANAKLEIPNATETGAEVNFGVTTTE